MTESQLQKKWRYLKHVTKRNHRGFSCSGFTPQTFGLMQNRNDITTTNPFVDVHLSLVRGLLQCCPITHSLFWTVNTNTQHKSTRSLIIYLPGLHGKCILNTGWSNGLSPKQQNCFVFLVWTPPLASLALRPELGPLAQIVSRRCMNNVAVCLTQGVGGEHQAPGLPTM